jgi:hypothetical protein
VNKEPIAGSLVRAHMVKGGQPYDLWAIILEHNKGKDTVRASVVEVVPEDSEKWTRRCIEPPPAGSVVTIIGDKIELVIHPRRRMTKSSSPQFVIKLNDGKLSDIYAIGKEAVEMRMVDLARHYCSDDSRQDFHRDVLVTQRGVEALDSRDSIG